MKKFILIFTLVFTFFITNINVSAEENITILTASKTSFDTNYQTYIRYKSVIDRTLNDYADSNDFYAITITEAGDLNDINLTIWDDNASIIYYAESYHTNFAIQNFKYRIHFYDDKIRYIWDNSNHENPQWGNNSSLLPDNLVDTNYNFYQNSYNTLEIEGLFSDKIILENGDLYPTMLQLYNYSSWNDYIGSQYTEVNLDNYEYVILNLKDYNKKAFETNLKVKGMIGITPVYEFGTIEKNEITDRCNISYDDFTNYRFFVLENDLLNNAVYVVKKCQNNSGFKFDSTIFDITYVTAENVDDPVITFGGKDYHTIPFKQLSNTANKNEEENFVPGANEEFKPFDDITNYISSFWDSLTTFMSLVTKFFNTLPIEIRAIAITTFMTGCTLGLIKIIKS